MVADSTDVNALPTLIGTADWRRIDQALCAGMVRSGWKSRKTHERHHRPPFIDGRTELYGEKFFVDHNAASGLMEPDNLFRLLEQYNIEATLLRTQSAATKLLDRVDGWQKIYSDDIATIHPRKSGAVHMVEPAVSAKE
jgi:hypothetical protein